MQQWQEEVTNEERTSWSRMDRITTTLSAMQAGQFMMSLALLICLLQSTSDQCKYMYALQSLYSHARRSPCGAAKVHTCEK